MGKTRMAAISTTGKSLVWVDLSAAPDQGLTGTEVRAVLDEVARRIDDHPDTELVVLDDLDLTPSVLSACRSSLEALLYPLQQNSTRLLITSQKALPPEFSALSAPPLLRRFQCPYLRTKKSRRFSANMAALKSNSRRGGCMSARLQPRIRNWFMPESKLWPPRAGHRLVSRPSSSSPGCQSSAAEWRHFCLMRHGQMIFA